MNRAEKSIASTWAKWRANSNAERPTEQPMSRQRRAAVAGTWGIAAATQARGKLGTPSGRRRGARPHSGVKIVELEILRDELVGLVEPRTRRDGVAARLLDDRAEAGVLEEVAAEGVAGALERLVARGDPRAAFHEVVAAVERGHGEVVVERMHLEALEGHDRRARPLPHVADDVAELPLRKRRHRAARREVLEVDVARRHVPRGLVARHAVAEGLPVGLGGQRTFSPVCAASHAQ